MKPLPPESGLYPGPGASATLHGLSAFTTLRTQLGQPLLFPEHLARLAATCAFLGLPAPDTALPVLPSLPWGLLRLTVTETGTFWSHRPLPLPLIPQGGADVWLTGLQVHPQLGRHKTGNYLPYLLAGREAGARGAFEGLLQDGQGHVADGSRCGLLLDVGGQLLVPDGGLPSLTRAAWLAELGLEAAVSPVSLGVLRRASQLWLCSSGVGVVPVGRVRGDGWEQRYPARWPQTSDAALVVPA